MQPFARKQISLNYKLRHNMGIRVFTILIILMLALPMKAQKKTELKEIWIEAESHYLYGEYELANPLYLMMDDMTPGNANIKYKIGNCYLNIFDEKPKAIPYLEAAAKNASYNSKTESISETKAPLDAYFSLAAAYRIANKLDSALLTYQMFQRLLSQAGEMTNQEFIDQQIQACNLASEKMKSPIALTMKPLEAYINQGSVNDRPAVSYDGKTMAYTERRGLENVVYITKMEGEKWGTPVDITAEAGMGTDCSTSSLNYDGTELYLFKNDNFDGNIYVTKQINGKWSPIIRLNKNINTMFYESNATISPDGRKLYFTSNREGTLGELDIWVSEKPEKGDWGPAVNMGNIINTPFNEETPYLSKSGNILTFSSEGHGSMGGYDEFTSVYGPGGWSKPESMGYPLNTTDDDIGYQPVDDGSSGYISLMTGYKKKEIVLVNFNETPVIEPIQEAEAIVDTDTTKFKLDYNNLPFVTTIDSSKLITNVVVKDVLLTDADDANVLYYTVQVMALHNPVDPGYFKHASIKVLYNASDKFYRYTTGQFTTKEKAYAEKARLLRLGYPSDIFVKKVYKE